MVSEIIKKRKSIRQFLDKEIAQADIETILEAAMLAPSAKNSRPWKFLVVLDKKKLNKLVDIPQTYYGMFKTAPMGIIVCIDKTRSLGDIAVQDCSAATQNILLQATELGLGSCWCAIYPHQHRIDGVEEIMGKNNNLIPFSLIAIGHPAEEFGSRGYYEEDRIKYIK